VRGASGATQELVYTLVREAGAWRIAVAGLAGDGDQPIQARVDMAGVRRDGV